LRGNGLVRRACALAAIFALVGLCGCATRIDGTGTSRVGIFLWGFGDPPGVNWDLDWPRSEVPDLPPTRPRELPDRPSPSRAPQDDAFGAPTPGASAGQALVIDDNRCRADEADFPAAHLAVSLRADPGRGRVRRA
jgi:hypothetical protein